MFKHLLSKPHNHKPNQILKTSPNHSPKIKPNLGITNNKTPNKIKSNLNNEMVKGSNKFKITNDIYKVHPQTKPTRLQIMLIRMEDGNMMDGIKYNLNNRRLILVV
jgi:hypothetical protein